MLAMMAQTFLHVSLPIMNIKIILNKYKHHLKSEHEKVLLIGPLWKEDRIAWSILPQIDCINHSLSQAFSNQHLNLAS